MIVLGFDTAGPHCSVALLRDGAVLARRSERLGRGHAERLFPMLEACLAEAELGWSGLDRLGVVAGPGSFTGLRVGVAAARGLALALDRPAIGVDAYEAIAATIAEQQPTDRLAVCFGRPDRLQWRLFTFEPASSPTPCGERRAGDVAALLADAPTLIAGPAAVSLAEAAPQAPLSRIESPDSVIVARLAAEADPDADPEAARPRPLYARGPDAAPPPPPAARLPSKEHP